jgi:hypothetical protein
MTAFMTARAIDITIKTNTHMLRHVPPHRPNPLQHIERMHSRNATKCAQSMKQTVVNVVCTASVSNPFDLHKVVSDCRL